MTAPINLNAVKWLQLCDQAEQAARLILPNRAADDLAVAAGRLTTVTPPHATMADTALATSFRWDCTAFGMALPEVRAVLAEALKVKARLVRALVDGQPPEGAAAAMAPPLPAEEPPAWNQRADIGG